MARRDSFSNQCLLKKIYNTSSNNQFKPGEFPNKLFVNFPRERERNANYNVMATDYEAGMKLK